MMLLVGFLFVMAILAYFAQKASASFSLALMACLGAWLLWGISDVSVLTAWDSVQFLNDGIASLMTALVLMLGTLVLFYSWAYFAESGQEHQHVAQILLLMAFSVAVCQAGDMFNLWLGFEGLTIASVSLVAFHRDDSLALEAAFKYLLQSALGSMLILAGIALVFAQTGNLSFLAVQELENTWLIGTLFIVGFGVKTAFVPLHTWLPDAHSQAPSGISALLSGMVIELALIAMLRFLAILGANFGLLLMGFAALNILVGNFLALKQDEIKRLLAFSSVAHLGYISLGFGIGFYTNEALAFEGAFFHLLSHGLMKTLAFLALGALFFLSNAIPLHREDLKGLGKRYPLIGFALSLALLGLGGLPPMVGFFSKWAIFVGGAATGDILVIAFILVAAIGSIISLGYYAPLVTYIYQETVAENINKTLPVPLRMRLPLVLLSLLILLFGLYPILLNPLVQNAALVWIGGQ